jgi:transcriptional regulator with XRE-family HTH domain
MSEYTYLAANLRRFRAEWGWSQAYLAQRAGDGFSQPYVSDLERGLRPYDPSHITRLAQALGLTEADLLRRVRRRVLRTAA